MLNIMDFKEFKKSVVPTRKNKLGKVRNSFGIYDVYKYIRKNNWYNIGRPLKEHEFYIIIRKINLLIAKKLAEGKSYNLPYNMGKLELVKSPRGVSILNGVLKVTYSVDWLNTLKLWYTDKDSYKSKTLLRHEQAYTYRIKYNKHSANYNNKSFYQFTLNSFIKDSLSKNIRDGKIDTLWELKY